ncbi:MAG: hypothetical protein WC356_01325 [Candidatus Micrarchaeia archaeon]|jgi:hypothetical protein
MELKCKKGISFATDALISLLILIIIIGALPQLLKEEQNNTEILLMKRYVDSALTMLDNNDRLDEILWLNTQQGKIFIESELNSLFGEEYEYNANIIIDTTAYSTDYNVPGEIVVSSRRVFFDTNDYNVIKRGYLEVEVWKK